MPVWRGRPRRGLSRRFRPMKLQRSFTRRAALLLTLFFLQELNLAMASSHLIFLGTYTRNGSKGIYAVRLDGDTGKLSSPTLAAETPDPAWITLTPDRKSLYAIHGSTAQAVGFSVDAATGALTPLPGMSAAAANPPSHLAVDATGRTLLAANYREGYVASIPIGANGTLGSPNKIQHDGK